jgi:molybdenum cofactor cytidylyltransferase
LAGIVVAAGASSRLGRPKQLLEFGGTALVVRAARLSLAHCDAGVLVVTGAHHERVAELLAALPVRAIYNPAWREGLGSSIRQGICGLPDHGQATLLMLVDQPDIDSNDLEALVSSWAARPDHIAAAAYAGVAGAPAIFPASCRASLLRLHGDMGAREMIRQSEQPTLVDMPHAAFDLDSPDDLKKLEHPR